MDYIERDQALVDQFVKSMGEAIRYFSKGRISDNIIKFMAEYEVNRLDFNNDFQMHKGVGYFAKMAVERYLNNG